MILSIFLHQRIFGGVCVWKWEREQEKERGRDVHLYLLVYHNFGRKWPQIDIILNKQLIAFFWMTFITSCCLFSTWHVGDFWIEDADKTITSVHKFIWVIILNVGHVIDINPCDFCKLFKTICDSSDNFAYIFMLLMWYLCLKDCRVSLGNHWNVYENPDIWQP